MTDRWRGRRPASLAIIAVLAFVTAGVVAAARDDGARFLVMRDTFGAELARSSLPASGDFALRYRNSIYGSVAEERFEVDGSRLRLTGLAVDELAVLEEYYTAVGASRADGDSTHTWTIEVQRPPIHLPLRIQGTALGQRTLLVDGREIALWKLVAGRDDTVVILSVEGTS